MDITINGKTYFVDTNNPEELEEKILMHIVMLLSIEYGYYKPDVELFKNM